MDYVKFGSTGMDISRLVLGCMSFGDPDCGNHSWTLGEDESRTIIRHALEALTRRVERSINGQYVTGHAWGFMLGYALALPADAIAPAVNNRLQSDYGAASALSTAALHDDALAIHEGAVQRHDGSSLPVSRPPSATSRTRWRI